MPVKFERIFINDSLQVTAGRIEMLTRSVQALRDSLNKDITIDGPTEGPITPGDSLPELPELIIPVVGTIEEIYINDQQQIVVTDADGNEQVPDREKDPETGDYVNCKHSSIVLKKPITLFSSDFNQIHYISQLQNYNLNASV